jgi:predicted O-methyltransferase YrrM
MSKRGIIYVATGPKYLEEALQSAASVRQAMPGFPMTLFTDQTPPGGVFERVIAVEGKGMGRPAKIRSMAESPYEETLFLDTDTWMCQPCEDIFWPLEKYDLAVVHEVYRNEYAFESFPDSFPALNTGVLVYRKNEGTAALFKEWERSYLDVFRHKRPADQPAFRDALFSSDLRHYILPPEYNFRTNYPVVLGGFARAKIIHDRSPFIKELASLLGTDTSHPPLFFGAVNWRFWFFRLWIRLRTLLFRARAGGLRGMMSRLAGRTKKGDPLPIPASPSSFKKVSRLNLSRLLFWTMPRRYNEIMSVITQKKLAPYFQRVEALVHIEAGGSIEHTSVKQNQLAVLLAAVKGTEHMKDPIIEIGSFRGVTTSALARATSREVVAVDPYIGEGGHPKDLVFFEKHTEGLANVRLVRRCSDTGFADWCNASASLVFIDAIHDFANTWYDFAAWSRLLPSGGMVAFHDVDQFPGVNRVCQRILKRHPEWVPWAYAPNIAIFKRL